MADQGQWVVDIETTQWTKTLCAVALKVDETEEEIFASLAELQRFIWERRGVWLAHYGGRFDHLLIMNHAPLAKQVILSGSSVLVADFGDGLELRDTFPLFAQSLEKIGQALGFEKWTEFDREHLERYEPSKVVEYCRRDCQVLAAQVRHFRSTMEAEGIRKQRWTAGSNALALFKVLELDAWKAIKRNSVAVPYLDRAQDAKLVRGGRSEVFDYGQRVWHCYDIKSSYPYSYHEGELPLGLSTTGPRRDAALHRCEWFWPHVDRIAPILGEKQRGAGHCKAWLTTEELEFLREQNPAWLRVDETLYATAWATVGTTFAAELFREKEANRAYKVLLNSLHGKFCEKLDKLSFVPDAARRVYVPQLSREPRPHMQPLLAAWILARARLRLTRKMLELERSGWRVAYCDTDSIHTDCPPSEFGELGNECGQWSYETSDHGAHYAPKGYGVGKLRRAKGVRASDIPEGGFARLALGASYSLPLRGLQGFRSSLRHGKRCVASAGTRTIQRVANHKTIRPDGRAIYDLD